jgi:hypothetical protein
MWAVTVMDACLIAFCNNRRSAPARRESEAYVSLPAHVRDAIEHRAAAIGCRAID